MKSNQAGIRCRANYTGGNEGATSRGASGEARDCVTCSRKPSTGNHRLRSQHTRLRHKSLKMLATQLVAIVKGRDLQHLLKVAKLWRVKVFVST